MPTTSPISLPARVSVVQQVAETIRRALQEGAWRHSLPGERTLSDQLNVSRPTLRAALAVLEREGWVGRSPAKVRRILRQHTVAGSANRAVRLLLPFPVQTAPAFFVHWIQQLRTAVDGIGTTFEVHHGERFYMKRPQAHLELLVRQAPASAWVLARATEAMQRWFSDRGLPCVIAGSCFGGVSLPSVDFDHRAVGRHAAGEFLRSGHSTVAILIPGPDLAGDLECVAGATELLQPRGAHAIVVKHDGTISGIRQQLDKLLRSSKVPTAFFPFRATAALTIASELTRRGIRFPQDATLISRDNDSHLDCFSPLLARYAAEPRTFARRLANVVIRLSKERSAPTAAVRLMPEFIKGETLGSLRSL